MGVGSLGVVTRLTLRTHSLPEFFGAVFATIKATSDAAFRRLISQMMSFYSSNLFNPHWGEQIAFRPGNVLAIGMVFQGLDQKEAETIWRPFFDWLAASPKDFAIVEPPRILAAPARHFWDPGFLKKLPGIVLADDRPGAPKPIYSGRATSKKRDRSCTATNPRGSPPRFSSERAGKSRRSAVWGDQALECVAAFQQGPRGRPGPSDRSSEAHGDESRSP